MENVIHSNSFNLVRKDEKFLYSSFTIMEPDLEAETRIVMDLKSLIITNADWEVHKGSREISKGFFPIKQIIGKSGYINGRKEINRALENSGGETLKYMLNQCINGVIQAETYIFRERGYKDKFDYEKYWDNIEKNGCLMYSTKNKKSKKWMDHAAPLERKNLLFHRNKSVEIRSFQKGRFQIKGLINDSNHEIYIELVVSRLTGCILDSEIGFLRAPDPVCMSNTNHAEFLRGQSMKRLDKSRIILTLGTSTGCYHLVDIMADILRLYKKNEGAY